MALPEIEGAGDDGDGTVFLENQLALFLHRRRGAFEEIADAAPAHLRRSVGLTGVGPSYEFRNDGSSGASMGSGNGGNGGPGYVAIEW